ncbi:MAG: hypothetical protein ABIU87_08590 [Ornithinibacter sp.]
MRFGVIDIGSTMIHLLVLDAASGAQPLPEPGHEVLREGISLRRVGGMS